MAHPPTPTPPPPQQPIEHLDIFEGYINLGLIKVKFDQKKGIQLILFALQAIQKYKGDKEVIRIITLYDLKKVGISL